MHNSKKCNVQLANTEYSVIQLTSTKCTMKEQYCKIMRVNRWIMPICYVQENLQ